MAGRFAAVSQRVRRSTVHLKFRRGTSFLINIGVPVLVGLARNESTGGHGEGAGLVLIVTALLFPQIALSSLKEGFASHKD